MYLNLPSFINKNIFIYLSVSIIEVVITPNFINTIQLQLNFFFCKMYVRRMASYTYFQTLRMLRKYIRYMYMCKCLTEIYVVTINPTIWLVDDKFLCFDTPQSLLIHNKFEISSR